MTQRDFQNYSSCMMKIFIFFCEKIFGCERNENIEYWRMKLEENWNDLKRNSGAFFKLES
jgi:hypothetical protein